MAFFDTFYKEQPTAFGHRLQSQKAKEVLRRLLCKHKRINRLLEIGPGWGELADLCVQKAVVYVAVEANTTRAVDLRHRGFAPIVSRVPPIPAKDKSFDAVVAMNVLEHMPDCLTATRFLGEMVRVAQNEGLICVNCPDIMAAGKLFWDADYTHNYPVSMRRLIQMFSDHGLRIIDATFFSGPVSGAFATPLSAMARLFPASLISVLTAPLVARERILRTRLTFIRNVFVIGCRYPERTALGQGKNTLA